MPSKRKLEALKREKERKKPKLSKYAAKQRRKGVGDDALTERKEDL